jgi:hypothetical protein
MKEVLQQELQENVPQDDPAYVSVVTLGKYSSDISGILLSVYPEHPVEARSGGKDLPAGSSSATATSETKEYDLPNESIGGAKWRYINGTVQMRMLKDVSPEASVEIVQTVLARIEYIIENEPTLRNFRDPWGHTIWQIFVADTWGYASGGEEISTIIHWVDWTALEVFRRTY